jgi:small G protein signaling modulator 3
VTSLQASRNENDFTPTGSGPSDAKSITSYFSGAGDASSITSKDPDATIHNEKDRAERASLGEWMGSWWIKGKHPKDKSLSKSVPTPAPAPPTEEEPSVQEILAQQDLHDDPEATVTSRPKLESRPSDRRRKARSVFGTLGFGILGPSSAAAASSSSTAKKPALKTTISTKSVPTIQEIVAPATTDLDEEATPTLPPRPASAPNVGAHTMLDSPEEIDTPPSSHPPSAPAETQSITGVEVRSAADSLSLAPGEKPPQGVALRAIVHATRVMTSDASSILADGGKETGPLVKELAFALVSGARKENLILREKPRERKAKSRRSDAQEASTASAGLPASTERPSAGRKKSLSDKNPGLTLATDAAGDPSHSPASTMRARETARKARSNLLSEAFSSASPMFGDFLAQQQRRISSVVDAVQKGAGVQVVETHPPAMQPGGSGSGGGQQGTAGGGVRSVALESIIPEAAKPPTQYLSRTYTPLTARDFRASIPLPNSAVSRLSIYGGLDQEPLTDRFGFMYDVSEYDALLLIRARECGNSAPACLTGVRIADRREDEGWDGEDEDEERMEVVKGACECGGEGVVPQPGAGGGEELDADSLSTRSVKSRTSSPSRSRPRSGTLSGSGSTSTAPTSVPSLKSDTSVLALEPATPRHACAATVRTLLDQLTAIHDERQVARRKEWDAFVKRRSKVKLAKASNPSALLSQSGGGAAAILGLGRDLGEEELEHSEGLIGFAQLGLSGSKDEKRELERLVRGGIPLVYRSKVWFECSGALEMREPGLFTDLLAGEGERSVEAEIEKDVGRTMPLNVFFGGDGAGVDKLRRVLTAYSRYAFFGNEDRRLFADACDLGAILLWATARA